MDDGFVRAPRVRDAPAARRQRKRRASYLAVALTVAACATSARAADVTILGRSTQGRPIVLVEAGDPNGIPVLVVGCIHGNENAGIAIARALEHESPAGIRLLIVPVLNPDGLARYERGNAHGVDLNRNFPYRWRPLGGVYESGPHPLSEVEARIAYRLIRRERPRVSIWFHQHRNLVWASGGNRRVEREFARVSGLPYHPLPALAGSAIDWQNHAFPGTTAFAAELPAGRVTSVARARYLRAIFAAARIATVARDLLQKTRDVD